MEDDCMWADSLASRLEIELSDYTRIVTHVETRAEVESALDDIGMDLLRYIRHAVSIELPGEKVRYVGADVVDEMGDALIVHWHYAGSGRIERIVVMGVVNPDYRSGEARVIIEQVDVYANC